MQTGIFKLPGSRRKECICFKTLYYICQSSNATPLQIIFLSRKEREKFITKRTCRNLFQLVTVTLQGTLNYCVVMHYYLHCNCVIWIPKTRGIFEMNYFLVIKTIKFILNESILLVPLWHQKLHRKIAFSVHERIVD